MGIDITRSEGEYVFSSSSRFPNPETSPIIVKKISSHTIEDIIADKIPTDIETSDDKCIAGVCGLKNLGNTCYMNAAIQCLAATTSLVDMYYDDSMKFENAEHEISATFTCLLRRMWKGGIKCITANKSRLVFGKLHDQQFADSSQHDCQEFLNFLLNELDENLLITHKPDFNEPEGQGIDMNVSSEAEYLNYSNHTQLAVNIVDKAVNDRENLNKQNFDIPDLIETKGSMKDNTLNANNRNVLTHERELCDDGLELKRKKLINVSQEKKVLDLSYKLSPSNCVSMKIEEKRRNSVTVIRDLFQGRFKCTRICTKCNINTDSHEDFLCLPIPLPFASELQICITYISASSEISNKPIKYVITLLKNDNVCAIRKSLINFIKREHGDDIVVLPLVIAKILNHRVYQILNDNVSCDDIKHDSIYAFEQWELTHDDDIEVNSENSIIENTGNELIEGCHNGRSETCVICLDDKEDGIKKHRDCECILCDECIKSYKMVLDGKFSCPVCRKFIPDDGDDLMNIEQADMKESAKVSTCITIVYRTDTMNEIKLFGHPAMLTLQLPNRISTNKLYKLVQQLMPYKETYKLLMVNPEGLVCSRCSINCKGCEVHKDSYIFLKVGDTLAISFEGEVEEVKEIEHESVKSMRPPKILTLNDCIDAFMSEKINCKCKNDGERTYYVEKYPKYLIIFLKRAQNLNKKEFKLKDVVQYSINDLMFGEHKYDLYACVHHDGEVISGGHYTAYTLHSKTNEWYLYDDNEVSKKKPIANGREYILFYKNKTL